METGDNVRGEHQEREQDPDRRTNNNISDTIASGFSSTTKDDDISSDDDKKNDENDDDENEDNPIYDEVYVDELRRENETLKKENLSLKGTIESYKKDYTHINNKVESQKRQYENYIRELNKKLNDSKNELVSNKNRTETFKTEFRKIQEELDTKKMDVIELKKNNAILREEASKYQSALGVAANFRISDDKNHSVQLKNDILSLQDAIETYVTHLKGNIEVNIENVEKLAQNYECRTNIMMEKTKRQNKPFIKAILQRYVLETIIEHSKKYFVTFGDILHLESEILMKTNDLCFKLNEFSKTRIGTDKITPTSSIKIRQEACAALSNRGFSEITENNQMNEHQFIYYVKHILNKSMTEFRTINDEEKRQSIENMATNIIRKVIRLLWFRLNVQEPIIKASWFWPNTKLDRDTMAGRWEEDDDIDSLVVDLCYFPIIGLNLDDPSKRKLYTRAKVFPRYQDRSYASSLFEKGCNMVKSAISGDKSESSTGHDSNEASNHKNIYQNQNEYN
ncbi:hypothetical protein RhiirA5_504277 [Rhizophagus irregularis]|uniref:Uncharacterized protein n=1 Tax=Rhizophagus irregularis TaxID=588596 RepID=A0A2N0P5C2_9GLOM|nr:hypothetical protein RhiirA5_504277 [Rhizophagus irregularis]CAB5127714.1 unnamed protein product [Rhizophagus irregularis]